MAFALTAIGLAQSQGDALAMAGDLKKMSLEELMDVEVTLVSMRPEPLSQAASAVQVITREDIRRSGALTLPEALRLAPNLQVAQLNGREWAVSARGFNATFANKLLVMIDGRTVYTPLYSGVFWDAQSVLLEDVDRIEVVSGPGGTLWGGNAVNGVINIVTKEAAGSQGLYASGGGGSLARDFAQARYGGRMGERASYRLYAQRLDRTGTVLPDGKDARNPSDVNQGGFRMDWRPGGADLLTAQGDFYMTTFEAPGPGKTELNGQNFIGRWSRAFSPGSELQAQAYFDRTWRESVFGPGIAFSDDLKTYDFDFHHRFPLGEWNSVLWGAGWRLMQDEVGNLPSTVPLFAFLPARKDLNRSNAFVQDEIALFSRRLKITIGSKFENEDYSGFNVQPSARAAFSPTDRHTLWGAVSRAVRTPSRIDVEFYAPTPPLGSPTLHYEGGPDFGSETVLAYELGYRVQPLERLTLSAAAFYNRYDDLRALEFADVETFALQFRNGLQGDSRGLEISGGMQAFAWWRLRAGYTYMERDLWQKPGHADLEIPYGKWADDPAHRAVLQSMMDLPGGFELNVSGYYVSAQGNPRVPPRLNYAAGVSWRYRNMEASVQGLDLADDHDPEFRSDDAAREEVPRSVSGRLTWRM
jgi:iron complex outermembrane receptor protein